MRTVELATHAFSNIRYTFLPTWEVKPFRGFKEVSPPSYRSMAAANVDLSAAAVAAPSPARPPRLAGSVPRARLQACEAAPTAARAA